MNKIAFFVEGQTEQIFINRLVRYLLNPKFTTIIQKKVSGGRNAPKSEMTIHRSINLSPKHEVLIVNCGSDNKVKSEMIDNMKNLENNGFKYIIGLRDLYPLELHELPKLEKGMAYMPLRFRHTSIVFDVLLAIREIEAWFLSEPTFFSKIDSDLTIPFISNQINYDITNENYKSYEHPASEINEILQLKGLSYSKRYSQAKKLVYSLDLNVILKSVRNKIPELDKLISYIEEIRDK